MKVFVLAGQSNMRGLGNAEALPEVLREGQDKVLSFEGGRWDVLRPYPRQAPHFGITGAAFGPEITFGREMSKVWTGQVFGLIKHAVGGTSLLAWAPEWRWEQAAITEDADRGPLYRHLMDRIRCAAGDRKLEFAGVLWMQGEKDARFREAAQRYGENFKILIDRIRNDLQDPRLPFLYGEVNSPSPYVGMVRKAQSEAQGEIPDTRMVSTRGLPKYDDHVHYDARGQMELGMRFARAYLDLLASR